MAPGYLERHNHGPLPAYPCDRHRIHTYGVLAPATVPDGSSSSRRGGGRQGEAESTLVAYLTLYRCGEFGMISMILGHGDHEDAGIMYLLIQGVIENQCHHGGFLYYNRHDSGTAGLTWKKESYGFMARDIEWVL